MAINAPASRVSPLTLLRHPPAPTAGLETLLVFSRTPADGHKPFLGAPAHLLPASSDLIDLIHVSGCSSNAAAS